MERAALTADELARGQAWRSALVAAALNVVGMPLDMALGRHVAGMPFGPSLLSMLVGVGLLSVLLARAATVTPRAASVAFLLNTAAIALALWYTSGAYAGAARWVPFQANKVGALLAGLLAPSTTAGVVSIAAYVLSALVKIRVLPAALRANLPLGEPWILLAYGAFGLALLAHRRRGLAVERRLLEARAEAATAQEVARTLLAVRDFANSPIQTLELGAALIRSAHPELRALTERLERAVGRLMELNDLLGSYERHLRWRPGEEAFDAGSVLARAPPDRTRPRRR